MTSAEVHALIEELRDPRGVKHWENRYADSYTFDTKKYEILPSQYPALDKVSEVLKMNPDLRIRIDGHTDSTGTEDFNQTLSENRAAAVRDYLEDAGIESGRLETRGFGTSAPVDSNDTPEGKARNRRCQLTVLR